jgi:predicted SnoaL-like aldol condensation-catalyzing enzyme
VGASENAAVMRRIFEEVINEGRLDLTEELYSQDHALHPAVAGVARGPAGMRKAFAALHEEFANPRAEIESLIAEGEMVAVRATFSGTHRESGERIYWPEMIFTRFADGKAAESWEVTDTGRTWTEAPW